MSQSRPYLIKSTTTRPYPPYLDEVCQKNIEIILVYFMHRETSMTTDPKGDLDPGLVAFFALRKELIISADKILNYTKPWLYRKIAKQTPAPHYRDLAELRENLELKEEDVQLSHCNSPLFGTLAYIDGIARRVLPQETKTHNSRLRKSDHALLAVVERLHPHIIKDVLILLPDEVVAKVNERSGALIQPVLSGGYKLMHHGPH